MDNKVGAAISEQAPKAEQKRYDAVIKGGARPHKKSIGDKFKDTFISEDAGNVKNYIVTEVLVPAAKKAVSDVITSAIDMLLYGGSNPNARHTQYGSYGTVQRIQYGGYVNNQQPQRRLAGGIRNDFDYEDILFTNRGDAEIVLSTMMDIIDQYGFVKVLDFYDLSNTSTNNYMTNKYGWNDISTARIQRVADGYVIRFPRPIPIDK